MNNDVPPTQTPAKSNTGNRPSLPKQAVTWFAWGYAIFFGLGGIATAIEHQVLAGCLFMASAALVLPTTGTFLQRHFPIPHSGGIRGIIAFVLLLVGAGTLPPNAATTPTAVVKPSFSFDPRGVAMAKLMLMDDFESYLMGKRVMGDWSPSLTIDERITAIKLRELYETNEIAADNKFKGKSIAITGRIKNISKDFLDSAYLVLEDGQMFGEVHAMLADESAQQASSFLPGDTITLICKGSGMILTSPILKDCQSVEVATDLQRHPIEQMVDDFFSGENRNLSDKTKLSLGYSYALGVAMPQDDICETSKLGDMEACQVAIREVSKVAVRGKYNAVAKELSLPPL